MKKILFLFALIWGIGISTAMATEMQPPGLDCVYSVSGADMTSNEMPVPAVMNVVSQNLEASYIINSPLVVYLDVETGSSGGMADWCLNSRGTNLQPLDWTQTTDQHRATNEDLTGCTQTKHSNTAVFAINCSYKFPLN